MEQFLVQLYAENLPPQQTITIISMMFVPSYLDINEIIKSIPLVNLPHHLYLAMMKMHKLEREDLQAAWADARSINGEYRFIHEMIEFDTAMRTKKMPSNPIFSDHLAELLKRIIAG